MRAHNIVVILSLVGCTDIPSAEPSIDTTEALLEIEPAELTMTVIDGKAVPQPYSARLTEADGTEHDVTAQTTFSLADGEFGSWSAATLHVTGDSVGTTHVLASFDNLRVQAPITVFVRNRRVDASSPEEAPDLFETATLDVSCSPTIAYPAAGVTMPRNAGELEIHWTDARDDLFEVSLSTSFVDVRIYTMGLHPDASFWTAVPVADWDLLASQGEPIQLRISGLVHDAPALACKSTAQRVYVTDHLLAGRMFFWDATGVRLHEAAHAEAGVAPVLALSTTSGPVASADPAPATSCAGCAVSHDGGRIALSINATGGHSRIFDLGSASMQVPIDGANNELDWMSATFNARSSKLITEWNGALNLISEGGAHLSTIHEVANTSAYNPQLSNDGAWLANVEYRTSAPFVSSAIVVRQFEDGTNSFGSTTTIVAHEPGTWNFNLSWSPDGQWLAFTRATNISGANTTSSIWVVKSDGTLPPIELTKPTAEAGIAARWAPHLQTSGAQSNRLFYLTFESNRAFGVRTNGVTQLWMMPFMPDLAMSGAAPSGPAFHLPVQSLELDTRIVQWTK